jgi:hypothetical protein
MDSAQLYSEPAKRRSLQPQAIAAACLLAALLIGASLGNPASEDLGCAGQIAACTNSSSP